MKTIWSNHNRHEIQQRVAALEPGLAAAWGTMDASRMVAHLVDALRMMLGELPVASKKLPIRYWPLKQLIIYWLPFPKGAPTAPELVGRAPRSWSAEVAQLETLIDRLAREHATREWPDHPAFGRLTSRAAGVLVYRHMDHHLRQFGV